MAEQRGPLLAVGLMSGTSLDGVSAALVRLEGPSRGGYGFELVSHRTVAYDAGFRSRLADAAVRGGPADLAALHFELGGRFADAALAVLAGAGVAPASLAFASSHGQTVWHEPRRASLQLGAPAVIAERLGVPVISDFRSRDIAAGGEGAPLVPRADRLLFALDGAPRALLNLGGIANLTFVPEKGSETALLGFDTGPGVMVIDACVRQLFPGRLIDEDGSIAASGRPVESVVSECLSQPFFSIRPPRSTGRELFGEPFARSLVARCLECGAQPADAVATAVEVTARAIGEAACRFVPPSLAPADVLRSGGGARNPALVSAIERAWPGVVHRDFGAVFFDGEAKEAVAFAFLGYLTWTGCAGNEPSATGAAGPRVLGCVTPP